MAALKLGTSKLRVMEKLNETFECIKQSNETRKERAQM